MRSNQRRNGRLRIGIVLAALIPGLGFLPALAKGGTLQPAHTGFAATSSTAIKVRARPTTGYSTGRVPHQLLVRFRAGAPARRASILLASTGGALKGTVGGLGVQILRVPNHTERVLRALRISPLVEFAERDGLAQPTDIAPNDPYWPNEWSQTKTRAPSAWDLTTGSGSVVIAVVDSGVDFAQPDLQGKLLTGYDFVNGDADASDDNGHGTAVAGIAGAASNNGVGVASYCWACQILPVKVLDSTAWGSYSNIASGITWATDHGARVINLSLAGTTPSTTLSDAVQYAHDHGAVVVAAAGNYGNSTQVYPAAYSQVLSVASTDEFDQLTTWSNYGSWVKLAAPGTEETTLRGVVYGVLVGTSAAAPVVAGIAGLSFSLAPSATNLQVEQAIETGTLPVGGSLAYGRVDARSALDALGVPAASPSPSASPAPSPSPTPSASPSPSPAPVTATFSSALNSKNTSRTYSVSLGAGAVTATLDFKKEPSLTLSILSGAGFSISQASGSSPVKIGPTTLAAGTYQFQVSGSKNASFTLTVTYQPP